MIIAVDIGNSNVVLGLVKDSKILQSWRLHTEIHQSVDEYEILVRGMLFACDFSLKEVHGAVLSSVVPELTDVFNILLENLIGQTPVKVSHELNLGITINTETPAKVGNIITFTQPGGELPGMITDVSGTSVTVDFNHPLAGQAVTFVIDVIEVK